MKMIAFLQVDMLKLPAEDFSVSSLDADCC